MEELKILTIKIATALKDKKVEEVGEFVESTKVLMEILLFILASETTKQIVLDNVPTSFITETLQTASKVQSTLSLISVDQSKFSRWMTTPHLRATIDREFTALTMRLLYLEQRVHSISRREGPPSQRSLLSHFHDEDGKQFWRSHFGAHALLVTWNEFISALCSTLKTSINKEDEQCLKYILDFAETNTVSVYKLAQFLQAFGPLSRCVQRARAVSQSTWFQGYLSIGEAKQLLSQQSDGSYLVRFTTWQPNAFTIHLVYSQQVLTVKIVTLLDGSFQITEQGGQLKTFQEVHQIVDYFYAVLRTPLAASFFSERWWFGDLQKLEIQELLLDAAPATFLICFGLQQDQMYLCYVDRYNLQAKEPVTRTAAGYVFNNKTYPSLSNLVQSNTHLIKEPCAPFSEQLKKSHAAFAARFQSEESNNSSATSVPQMPQSSMPEPPKPTPIQQPTQRPLSPTASQSPQSLNVSKATNQTAITTPTPALSSNYQVQKVDEMIADLQLEAKSIEGIPVPSFEGALKVLDTKQPLSMDDVESLLEDLEEGAKFLQPLQYMIVTKDFVGSEQERHGCIELNINANDVVVCLEHFTDGWVKVELNGVIGIIPASYLREYEAPADGSANPGSNPSSPHEVRAKPTEPPNPEDEEKKLSQMWRRDSFLKYKDSPRSSRASFLGRKDRVKEKEEAESRKKELIIEEILATEKAYVSDLETAVKVFQVPLQRSGLAPVDDIAIFSNISLLVSHHKEFLKDLEEVSVAEAFLRIAEFFKLYVFYCTNYTKALQTIEDLKKNSKKFLQVLEEQESSPKVKGLRIGSYLIKPIQRITKYPLLLKELVNATSTTDPEYEKLNKALQKATEIVNFVNEGKREAEKMQKLLQIQESLSITTFPLAVANRQLILEATVRRGEGSKYSLCKVFLFNDMFMWAKEHKNKFLYQGTINISDMKLVDVGDSKDFTNVFEVSDRNNPAITITISLNTPAEKKQWVGNIKSLVKEAQLKDIKQKRSTLQTQPIAESSTSIRQM